ncbi:MAG: NTP transferase domain-containing protein [Melioribacteraceae bacterium]|jgi:spore coat polysaccharide biosynthesis protein SpsF|nr:NTP transferase domain-containing protein [Melioribacteraceae bacterium]
MKITTVIQARMGSNRLPGKVLYPLGKEHKPVLQHLIERIKRAKTVDDILIVTTDEPEDNILEVFTKRMGCKCWRGKKEFVLDNILNACIYHKVQAIVDVTADCPLIDPKHIDVMVKKFKNFPAFTYVSNVINRSYPRGFDIQIYSPTTLLIASNEITNYVHKTHSGWNIMIREDHRKQFSFIYGKDYQDWRLCIDEEADYQLMRIIFDHFKNNKFSAGDVIKFLEKNLHLLEINKRVQQKVPGKE